MAFRTIPLLMQLDLRGAIWGSIGGFFGDIVGIGLGYGMTLAAGQVTSQVTAEMMRAESQIACIAPSFTMDNFPFVFAVVVSLLAGAYPAWRASRLDPVVELRKE